MIIPAVIDASAFRIDGITPMTNTGVGFITDDTLATASDTNMASALTVKTYADTKQPAGSYLTAETDPVVGAINGIVKANGAGVISLASAGTDYQAPLTLPLSVANGGTGLSTIAANRIPYATALDTIGSSANLTFDGTNLACLGVGSFYDIAGKTISTKTARIRLSRVAAYIDLYPSYTDGTDNLISISNQSSFGTNDLFLQFQPQTAGAFGVFECYARDFYISTNGGGGTRVIKLAPNKTVTMTLGVNLVTITGAATVSTTLGVTGLTTATGGVLINSDSNKLTLGAGSDMSIDYDGTQGNIRTDLVAASDLHIDCGTDKTVILDETVWDDLQFVTSTGKVPAANYPTWEAFTTNTEMYAFSVDDKIQLEANEPMHGWKEGTVGSAHLHFCLKTAQTSGANQYAKFELIFAYSDYNGIWAEQAALTAETTIPTATAAKQSYLLSMGSVTLTGLHLGSQITCRARRIAATGGTEYADDVYITQVGVHLECDTLGSRTVSSK
jgi:hypothetical protein